MQGKRKPEEYPVVIRQIGNYIRAINYEFGVEHFEALTNFSESEKFMHIAQCVAGVYTKIAQKMDAATRNNRASPPPIPTPELLGAQMKDGISLKEACNLLGERPHNVRRMADDGTLSTTRTRKGHRRFSRDQIEAILLKRSEAPL